MNEWPLLIFTVCIPAAVGGFLFLGLFHKQIAGSGADSYQTMKLPLIVLAGLSLVGLLVSFPHLGTPTHAFYTLSGFGRSWMSNEIVFTGAFIALACITAGLVILQKKPNLVLIVITAIIGLVDVYCTASAYAVTRVNGWGTINTYLVFYGTVFTLGPVLSTSLMGTTLDRDLLSKVIKWAFVAAIFGMGIQVIGTAIFSVSASEIELIGGTTAAVKLAGYSGMITVRWILELVGLIALGFAPMSTLKKVNGSFIYLVVAVFIVSEAMSRYVFYVMGA